MNQQPFSDTTLLTHRLELQAMVTDRFMMELGLPGRVIGGGVKQHCTVMRLDVIPPFLAGRKLASALAEALSTAVTVAGDQVTIEHPAAPKLSLLDMLTYVPRDHQTPGRVALGVWQGQYLIRPVLIQMAPGRMASHLIVVAPKGWGKTTLLQSAAAWIALTHNQREAQILLFDKSPLAYLPHARLTEADPLEMLGRVVQERRREGVARPHLFALVDNLDRLPKPGRIGEILTSGPAVGVHVLATVTDVGKLNPLVYRGFPVNICGRVEADAGWYLTDNAQARPDKLRRPGEFVVTLGSDSYPMQAACINPYDLHLVIAELHRQQQQQPAVTAQPLPAPAYMRPEVPAVGVEINRQDAESSREIGLALLSNTVI